MRRSFVLSAVALIALLGLTAVLRADDDTPAAKKARDLLKQKVTCDYKDTPTRDVLDDLQDQVPGLKFKTVADGTIKLNHNFTYAAKDLTVAEALDKMFGPIDWGYIVKSQKGDAYDGVVMVRGGKERGTPADKDKPKDK